MKQRRRCLRQSLVRDAVVTAARLLGWGLGLRPPRGARQLAHAHLLQQNWRALWCAARSGAPRGTRCQHLALLTVADRKANVTVANLRESLKECEIPASRHDSWIATISKYLGESGAPAVLKAPRESAPPSVRTNVKKHQRLCPPIGKEIGVEGFWPGCAKALIRASSPSHRRVSEAQAAPGDGPKQWLMQPTTALDRGLPDCSGLPFSLGIKPVTCPVLTPPRRNPVGAREGHTFQL